MSQPFGRDEPSAQAPTGLPDLVVAASGNLANIYFPGTRERLTLEDLVAQHPGLLEGLVSHPGIGFALVRSNRLGAIAIGREGIHYLDQGRVDGRDPLEVFGKHAPDNLRRLDSFQHVGDILLNSMYDPSTEEIAPFEHQVGAHGGLGGPQTKAFVLYPSALEVDPDPIALVGAEAVNGRIRAWMARARELHGEAVVTTASDTTIAPVVAQVLDREVPSSNPV